MLKCYHTVTRGNSRPNILKMVKIYIFYNPLSFITSK